MNTHHRFTVGLVTIAATCVLTAGAASAKIAPAQPVVLPTTAPSAVAHAQPDPGGNTSAQQLGRRSYVERMQRALGERAAAQARSHKVSQHVGVGRKTSPIDPGQSTAGQGSTSGTAGNSPQHSGVGTQVPLLAVTALAGLALGAAGSAGSRRLRNRSGLAA